MAKVAYIGLGSNLGDRVGHIEAAIKQISEHPDCQVLETAPLYETEPLGNESGGWFLNSVICVETILPPRELLELLFEIESSMGRRRDSHWAPRTIDLDILFYDQLTVNEGGLTIPHPQLHIRRFVLEPLAQIAPSLIHPVFKQNIYTLLANLQDPLKVVIFNNKY